MSTTRKTGSGLAPVLKWVGGKRQLLGTFDALFPSEYASYCEPFLGGGAVLLHLTPDNAIVSDVNAEIINLYQVIRDDVNGLLTVVKQFTNDRECYNKVRLWDRSEDFADRPVVERAARTLYMNRACFNGVYRVNQKGYFNVPFGRYKSLVIDEENIQAVSAYFQRANIEFCVADYADTLSRVPDGAFVYLDPPYDPVSVTASFTSYAKDGFSQEDQVHLKECCDILNARGVKFMLSNSATDFIKDLYKDYDLTIVKAKRAINRNGSGRGAVDEIVVRNYVESQMS